MIAAYYVASRRKCPDDRYYMYSTYDIYMFICLSSTDFQSGLTFFKSLDTNVYVQASLVLLSHLYRRKTICVHLLNTNGMLPESRSE